MNEALYNSDCLTTGFSDEKHSSEQQIINSGKTDHRLARPDSRGRLLLKFTRSKLSRRDIPAPSDDSEFKTICYECKYGKSSKSKNGWYRCRLLLKHTDPDFKPMEDATISSGRSTSESTRANKRVKLVCKIRLPQTETSIQLDGGSDVGFSNSAYFPEKYKSSAEKELTVLHEQAVPSFNADMQDAAEYRDLQLGTDVDTKHDEDAITIPLQQPLFPPVMYSDNMYGFDGDGVGALDPSFAIAWQGAAAYCPLPQGAFAPDGPAWSLAAPAPDSGALLPGFYGEAPPPTGDRLVDRSAPPPQHTTSSARRPVPSPAQVGMISTGRVERAAARYAARARAQNRRHRVAVPGAGRPAHHRAPHLPVARPRERAPRARARARHVRRVCAWRANSPVHASACPAM